MHVQRKKKTTDPCFLGGRTRLRELGKKMNHNVVLSFEHRQGALGQGGPFGAVADWVVVMDLL